MPNIQENSQYEIITIDDTPANLYLLTTLLRHNGYQVRPFPSGKLALMGIQYAAPALILLDIEMPIMNGYEVCQQLKENELTRDIPVIFISAFDEAIDKVRAFAVGGVDYITKPFQLEEILARIATHLDLSRLQKLLKQENYLQAQQLAEQNRQLQEMNQALEQANQRLAEYSQTLQESVEQRTQELSQTSKHLQTTQSELIQAEKMSALGQLTASVAHEINTPLGVIRSAASNIAAALSTSLQQIPTLLKSFSPQQQTDFWALVNDALSHQTTALSTYEERQLRRQLQQELMVHGIAQAEQVATQLMLLRLGPQLQAYQATLQAPNCLEILQAAYSLVLQQQSVSNIQQEVDRAAKIVFALKTYSHQDNLGQKVLAKITDGIEVVLTLYQNRLKQGIQLVRRYDPVPAILCDPDVLTQVWVNLVDNAIYAMGQEGILEVAVTQQDDQIVVTVRDSGCGIPPEIQAQVFEPFFTTKPRGEGSGLGLDIVMQILQKQGGTIQLDSQPGNTLFTVKLPISNNEFSKLPNSEIDHE